MAGPSHFRTATTDGSKLLRVVVQKLGHPLEVLLPPQPMLLLHERLHVLSHLGSLLANIVGRQCPFGTFRRHDGVDARHKRAGNLWYCKNCTGPKHATARSCAGIRYAGPLRSASNMLQNHGQRDISDAKAGRVEACQPLAILCAHGNNMLSLSKNPTL